MKNGSTRLWVGALGAAFVCLGILTIALGAAGAPALFYLYSFERDPKRWTNVTVFYYRPKHEPGVGEPPEAAPAGSLVVRGRTSDLCKSIQIESGGS